MYSFTAADKKPLSDPALEPNGKLLGYTQSGGPTFNGTIYELTP
ncbi:MAG TPA: hypothetical protein VL899_11540 [Alphaproteobacteria bacterium]|nr:hypothetical protein [Alphaproteobacteria bacterium]